VCTDPLTYKASGVDIESNNESNKRIKEQIKRTHNHHLVMETGLFAGGISLSDYKSWEQPLLVGSLGYLEPGGTAAAANLYSAAAMVVESCLSSFPPAAEKIAFLDYLAASRLDVKKVESLVTGFADVLSMPPLLPLAGGETAEMPGVFQSDKWEVVGALYGVSRGSRTGFLETGQMEPGTAEEKGVDISCLKRLKDPVLMLSMDGVGTKARLGVACRQTRGLAGDIVNHSLNDLLCQGGRGLAIMVYLGCHTPDQELIEDFREGLAEWLAGENLNLLDLKVAPNKDLYLPGEYDICASIAGLVDRQCIITGAEIEEGDLLIGLASEGLHSNGYSLAAAALLERGKLKLDQYISELNTTLGEALLVPHRSYTAAVHSLLKQDSNHGAIRGIAHITGGGLQDNLCRILPQGLGAEMEKTSFTVPPIFSLIQRCGRIPEHDPLRGGMYETFNMGVGLVLAVGQERAADVASALRLSGEEARVVGMVVRNPATAAQERVKFLP
jgi:phosphoribosylformylglycinamidine cyclo-ligase